MAFKFFGFIIFFCLIIGFCYIVRLIIDTVSDYIAIKKLDKDLKRLESNIKVRK